MKPDGFYLMGKLGELDALMPEGKLTWTMAFLRLVDPSRGTLPSGPEKLLAAVALGREMERIREKALL